MNSKKKTLLSNLELSAFCDQISMIVSAGIPIYEGISILADDADDKDTKRLLNALYQELEYGLSFSAALSSLKIFPKYLLDMVTIGEKTGTLDNVLSSLSVYYAKEASIRTGIKYAVTYPFIMVGMMLTVIFVLLAKVLPVFDQIYKELGTELTGIAAGLMWISKGINHYLIAIICIIFFLFIVGIFVYRSHFGKVFLQGRRFNQQIAASRFANCMALALSSGLNIEQGIDLALNLVDNPHMEEKIRRCSEFMKNGYTLSDSILSTKIFDKIYTSMITIGFKTGHMDQVMEQISKEYEEEIDVKINHFISILEPALVIILSIVVGIILLSFLLPLLRIISSIG